MMRLEIETITPRDAESALKSMGHNRAVRMRHVEKMAADMLAGQWCVNGAAVVFDDAGRLIDGQHRMHACLAAHRPFRTAVLRGVNSDEIAPTIDTGKARTFGDALAMRGVTRYRNELASAVRHIMALDRGLEIREMSGASHSDLAGHLDSAINEAELIEAAEIAAPAKVYAPTGPLAAIYYVSRQAKQKKVAFTDAVANGAELYKGHPALTYREWVIRHRVTRACIRPDQRLTALVRAWNAFCDGRQLSRVVLKSRPETA
ncbi:hypothetical protein [uncultured Maricaulis sp.]|uniref:hypothetical protein n=1 Tax=uncultured Maricaulis sp. TaxID=174710 RepID=UPI0030DCB30A